MALQVVQTGSGNPRPLVLLYLRPDSNAYQFPSNVAVVADTGPEGSFDERQNYYASAVTPLDQLLPALSQQFGASFSPVVIVGYSMGGFAVRRILSLGGDPDGVILADATYGSDLAAWTKYAQRAIKGERVLVASHSSSRPQPWQNLKSITGFDLPFKSDNSPPVVTRVGNAVIYSYADTSHTNQGAVVLPTVLLPKALELLNVSSSKVPSLWWIALLGSITGIVGYKVWAYAQSRTVKVSQLALRTNPEGFVFDDGGRAAAGYLGSTRDCVTRSIAIATGKPYQEVYDALNKLAELERPRGMKKRSSSRSGVHRTTYERYLRSIGWHWVPVMKIGSGCTVHLRSEELPKGRLIARLSKHLTAVIDGVIHDTFDPSREGTRCVYGYFTQL